METLNIAVVSPDEAYNRVLCMSLLDACGQICVTAFTTREFVLQWAEYHGPGAFYDTFDLILWAGDEIMDSYGDNIVFLTDRTSLVDKDYNRNRFSVYRYSSAETLIAELFDIYSHLTGRSALLIRDRGVRLLAFASYSGGTGCTTLARAVCQELARFYGRRVMYLSLENVESAEAQMVPSGGVRTEGEYLYRLLGKSSAPFLDSYLVKDDFGVRSFAPSAGKNPLADLTGEDMQKLLAALMESGSFDIIVTDLSSNLGEAALTVLESAERICIVARSAEQEIRERRYLNQIAGSCGEAITGKIVRTVRPERTAAADYASPLEGKFGTEISELTASLLNVLQ